MSLAKLQQQALQAQTPPPVTVPDSFVQLHHRDSTPEKDVYRALHVALGLGGGPSNEYYTQATQWRAHKAGNLPNIFFLKFMILMAESSHLMGGLQCLVDPSKSSDLYAEIVRVQAKKNLKPLTSNEETLLRNYVIRGHYCDLRFDYDVDYETDHQRWLAEKKKSGAKQNKKKKKAATTKKKKAADGREPVLKRAKVMRPVAEMDEAEFADENGIPSDDDEIAVPDWNNGDEWLVQNGYKLPGQMEEEEEDEEIVLEEMEVEEEEEPVALQEEEEEEEKFREKEPYVGPGRVQKMAFVVTEIPSAAHDGTVVGMVCTLLIKDPSINPGSFYMRMLENVAFRKQAAQRQMGGRGGVAGPFREMFPNYSNYFLSDHPAGDSLSLDLYGRMLMQLDPRLLQNHFGGSMADFNQNMNIIEDGPTHLYHALRIEIALESLLRNGGDPVVIGNQATWIDRATGTAMFPPQVRTWKYPPQAVFWHHKTDVGFYERFFPFVDSSGDFLRSLCSGENLARFFGEDTDQDETHAAAAIDDAFTAITQLLTSRVRVQREAILDTRLISYDTPNEFIHAYYETRNIYKHISELLPAHYDETLREVQALVATHGVNGWRQRASRALALRVDECETYNKALAKTQQCLTEKFCALFQLDGDLEGAGISDAHKVIVKWYRKNRNTTLKHMSRDYVTWDKDLDLFGNTMIQQLSIYVYSRQILQPIICMLAEGLFSCYDTKLDELTFNMLVVGSHGGGKTLTLIDTPMQFSCIPDSVVKISSATPAADVTARHNYDFLFVTDEAPEYLISAAKGEKEAARRDKEKEKMTSGQLRMRIFQHVPLPNGDIVRWNADLVTDHKQAGVFTSNLTLEKKAAITSRFLTTSMKESHISASKVAGVSAPPALSADMATWLHINQFLSFAVRKAQACGAIHPEVEMTLFNNIANQMIDVLKEWGVLPSNHTARSLDIIRPLVRQLVYKTAARCAFDLPGSENFHKPFSPEQICAMQPYLYVTVSQIYWALTACSSEFIDEDCGNVLRAMEAEAGVTFLDKESNYNVYESDINNRVPWRISTNKEHDKSQKDVPGNSTYVAGDAKLIDINYLTLKGKLDVLAERISLRTKPRMHANAVIAVLDRLKLHMIKPERGGYAPQGAQTFKEWHRFTNAALTEKKLGSHCPAQYNKEGARPPGEHFRNEDDVAPYGADDCKLPMVDMSELSAIGELYFMPRVHKNFDTNMLLTALTHITMCATTPPGKILTGIPDSSDPTRCVVVNRTQADIDGFIERWDAHQGWTENPVTHELVFGDDKIPTDMQPVPRRQGIVFNNYAAWGDEEAAMITTMPWAPKTDNSWHREYSEGAATMTKQRHIVADLDEESARAQHIRCGRPLDEPIRTPAWIAARIGSHHLGINYPDQQAAIRKDMQARFKASQKIPSLAELKDIISPPPPQAQQAAQAQGPRASGRMAILQGSSRK